MRRLILRGVALLLAVVATCVALLTLMPKPDNTFFVAAADKWRAAGAAGSPKLLIVGGSNTAFGVDSRSLSDALALPVVNMGLHAGLGLEYILDEASHFIGEGDIVVVSPEYEQFYGGQVWGRQQLVELAWLHPPSLRFMTSPRQISALAAGFPPVFQNRLRSLWLDLRSPDRQTGHAVYHRDAFNDFGDVVSHLDATTDRVVEDMPLLRDTTDGFNPAAIHALNDFHDEARDRGARVFIMLPTIPEHHYRLRRDALESIWERLRDEATAPALGTLRGQVGDNDHFFDTAYHLSREGRAAQTRRLLGLLRAEAVAGGGGADEGIGGGASGD